jgi:hypothetical protein
VLTADRQKMDAIGFRRKKNPGRVVILHAREFYSCAMLLRNADRFDWYWFCFPSQ